MNTLRAIFDRLPTGIVVILCLGVLSIPTAWLISAATSSPILFITELRADSTQRDPNLSASSTMDVPAHVLTVSLNDQLVDPPAPKPLPEPPPPKLNLELIAIIGTGDDRKAFIADRDAGESGYMSVGHSSKQGAVVESIEDRAVVLVYSDRQVRLELPE